MSGDCPELRRFWGLGPRPDAAEGTSRLRIEAGASTPGRVVSLELDEALRPAWLPPGEAVALWVARALGPEVAGQALAWWREGTVRRPVIVDTGQAIVWRFDPEQVLDLILHERYFVPRRPLHTRLALPYQLVPGPWRLRAFRLLTRWTTARGPATPFPDWPVAPSVEALRWAFRSCWSRVSGAEPQPPSHWPGGKRYAFALSHDVDTAAGLRLVPELAAFEEGLGLTATWFLLARRYALDDGALDRLRQAGHEIALHGDTHDNRIAYADRETMTRRLASCSRFVARHAVTGFRSPSLLETPLLRELLAGPFAWASQTPDTETEALIAPRRGCATCFPFVKHGLLELPITLPIEDKLLLAGLDEAAILALWRGKLRWIREVGGLASLVVHSEPHLLSRCRGAFQAILKDVAEDNEVWRANLGAIARWWQESKQNG